jgi:hypothetical protein
MFRKYRIPLLGLFVIALGLLWYAFRPEKLFINQRVNEAAPATAPGAATLAYIGRLANGLHDTAGRASLFKMPDGSLELRLSNFSTSNGPDVHVILTNSTDPALKAKAPGQAPAQFVELGSLKGNQGDQNYSVPTGTDLAHNDTVVIYCERFHAVFGFGKLEMF